MKLPFILEMELHKASIHIGSFHGSTKNFHRTAESSGNFHGIGGNFHGGGVSLHESGVSFHGSFHFDVPRKRWKFSWKLSREYRKLPWKYWKLP